MKVNRSVIGISAFLMLVAGLASAPTWLPHAAGERVSFDPGVAIDALTLIVVSAYTYLTYQLLRHSQSSTKEELERRRRSLATAILAELVLMEDKLRDLYEGPVTEYASTLRHPILDLAISQVDIFDPGTTYLLTRVQQDVLRMEPIAREHWEIRRMSQIEVSLSTSDCNRVAFCLSLMRDLQERLRPLAPEFNKAWRTFPHDRMDRIPIGDSMFDDLPEILFGGEVPELAGTEEIEHDEPDLGHR